MRRFLLGGLLLGVVATLLLAVTACDGGNTGASVGQREEKLKVVTSLGIFADLVREVGGDRVEVRAVIPAGADPETFEPTPRDVQRLSEADVLFINGLGLEAAIEQTIKNVVTETTHLVRLGDESRNLTGANPHLWLDVGYAMAYAKVVLGVLNQTDPDDATTYTANFSRYSEELTALDEEVKGKIAGIPPERRKLVTTHDAFPYFADYLGLELVGFATPTEAQEPSPRDIQQLVTAIRDEKVPAVFSEPGFRDVILKQVAAEAGVQICVLYSDALDDRVQTYIDMMRFNADELVRCLGGAAGG